MAKINHNRKQAHTSHRCIRIVIKNTFVKLYALKTDKAIGNKHTLFFKTMYHHFILRMLYRVAIDFRCEIWVAVLER